MDRRPLRSRDTRWARGLAAWFASRGVSANSVSILSMFFATLGAASILLGERLASPVAASSLLIAAAVCIQLRLLCNLLDGMIAIEGNYQTPSGEMMNDAPDRFSDAVLFIAAGYAIPFGLPHIAALGWAAALLSVSSAYTRYLGRSMSVDGLFLGPMAKPHRMAALTLACLVAAVEAWLWPQGWAFAIVLGLIIAGTALTIARRLWAIRSTLEGGEA